MSNSLPDKEAPVNLRASKALSLPRDPVQAPGSVAAGQAATPSAPAPLTAAVEQTRSGDEQLLTPPALAAGAVALLLGTGWLLRRRQRLAHRAHRRAAPVALRTAPPAPQGEPAEVPAEATVKPFDDSKPMADVIADLASQFEDGPGPLQPHQTFPAPLEPQHRTTSRMAVAGQKRLIKSLMWVRTVAGGAAVVAAIALIVFWSIEVIDRRAGDTGLTQPLLLAALAAWAASWGAGLLANQLHRMFFGRVHPKFDN